MDAVEPTKVQYKLAEEDLLRAQLYDLLSQLLHAPPTNDQANIIAALESQSEGPFGCSINALAKSANNLNSNEIKENFELLFIGMGRGILLPFASFYLTGFLNEKPLAQLRAAMKQQGLIKRSIHRIPEDHAGSILEIMSLIIKGAGRKPASLPEQKQFFEDHIQSWMPHFFADLANEEEAHPFYRIVGELGKSFLTIESSAFAMLGKATV